MTTSILSTSDRRLLQVVGFAVLAFGFVLIRAATEASGEVSRFVLRETAPVAMNDAFAFLGFGLAFSILGMIALVVMAKIK